MIHHWKALDLEITDFEYHHDRTRGSEFTPSQTSRQDIRGHYFIIRAKRVNVRPVGSNNNISERRCELKANEPVNERSERASVDVVG